MGPPSPSQIIERKAGRAMCSLLSPPKQDVVLFFPLNAERGLYSCAPTDRQDTARRQEEAERSKGTSVGLGLEATWENGGERCLRPQGGVSALGRGERGFIEGPRAACAPSRGLCPGASNKERESSPLPPVLDLSL